MSVLVYAESEAGSFKKIAFEAVSYAKGVADQLGTHVVALVIGNANAVELGIYGAAKAVQVNSSELDTFNAKQYASVISQTANSIGVTTVILPSSANSKYLAPLVAANLEAGYVPNVVALPESTSPMVLRSAVYTNKAFATTQLATNVSVIGLSKNAYGVHENPEDCQVETLEVTVADSGVTVTSVDKATDKVTIADAEVVVSGGRGLKGPENWNLIEDLADVLGAATACSKPVSDMGWRPHSEHVGQTGKPVATNLYIAIGISGAIQHLAGINSSKVKVVINTDPEAPFFKAADYGIVGDAFEVVPELTKKLKEFKANNA